MRISTYVHILATFNSNCTHSVLISSFEYSFLSILYIDMMESCACKLHRPIRGFRLQFAIEHKVKVIILQTIGEFFVTVIVILLKL